MVTEFAAAAFLVVFALLVIVAALKDVTSFTIPNWISLTLVAAFFLGALAAGLPLPVIGKCAAVGGCVLLISMAMFALNWIGGGDAKLFAACALWMGWPAVLPFLLATALAGGALALLLLQMRSAMFKALVDMGPPWLGRLAAKGGDAPYGLAIAIGALITVPHSPLFAAAGG